MILSNKLPHAGAYCLRPLDPVSAELCADSLLRCASAVVGDERFPLEEVEKKAVGKILPDLLTGMVLSSRSPKRVSEADFAGSETRGAFRALRDAVPDLDPFMERVVESCVRDWMKISAEEEMKELQVLEGAREEAYDSYLRQDVGDRRYLLEVRGRAGAGRSLHLRLGFSSFTAAYVFARRLYEAPEISDLRAFTNGVRPERLLPARIKDTAYGEPVAEISFGDGVPVADVRGAMLAPWPEEGEESAALAQLAGPDAPARVPFRDARDVLTFLELCQEHPRLFRSLGIESDGRAQTVNLIPKAPQARILPPQMLIQAPAAAFAAIREQAFAEVCDGGLKRFLDLAAENPGIGAGNLLLGYAQLPADKAPSRILTPKGWQAAGRSVVSGDACLVMELPDGHGDVRNTATYAGGLRNWELGVVPGPKQVCACFGKDTADPAAAARMVTRLCERMFPSPINASREDREFLRTCASYVACRALGLPTAIGDGFLYAAGKEELVKEILRFSLPAARETVKRVRERARQLENPQRGEERAGSSQTGRETAPAAHAADVAKESAPAAMER